MQCQGAIFLIILAKQIELRGASLTVPTFELRKIQAGCGFHGGNKIVAGNSLAIVAREVDIHASAECLWPKQGMQHADHFGAFIVDSQGVEVVNLHKGGRPNRMRHGAGIFSELQ